MTEEYKKLEPEHLKINQVILLASIVSGLIALLTSWFLGEFDTTRLIIMILVLLVVYLLSFLFLKAQHKRFSYFMNDQGLYINKGVFWRKKIVVPINRVQHTDITQGPIARRYDLAELIVHTAGTKSASVKINGILHKDASTLRENLSFNESDGAV